MDIVDRIFKLVDRRFPEQKDFAAALGTSTTMISAWRTRKSSSYNRRLPQIAKVLDTTVEYLLVGEQEEPVAENGNELLSDVLFRIKKLPENQMPELERFLRFLEEDTRGKP